VAEELSLECADRLTTKTQTSAEPATAGKAPIVRVRVQKLQRVKDAESDAYASDDEKFITSQSIGRRDK
jgi:hypothetical protein